MKRGGWSLWVPLALFAAFLVLVGALFFALVGYRVSTADLTDGKPRLLNIWASWCVPCAAEAPQLAALQARGAEIVSVAIRDRPEDVAAFLAQYGNPYSRIGADDLSIVQLGIGSSGVPETFVVDGRGIIRYQHIGDVRASDVPMLLDKLREAGE